MNNVKKAIIVSFLCIVPSLLGMDTPASQYQEEKENFVTISLMRYVERLQKESGTTTPLVSRPTYKYELAAHLEPLARYPIAEKFAEAIKSRVTR